MIAVYAQYFFSTTEIIQASSYLRHTKQHMHMQSLHIQEMKKLNLKTNLI